ncbi:MAG: RNA polymerase sigma factor [Bacteroidales bacterium]|jgi:RNA polymerase sigma-70 factor (ECF subfamily)|nr:RNA polymerase sigma factor [Bacteroidales bacterium]
MEDIYINKYIDLCKHGNTDAFKYVVCEYQQLVYTLAFRILCNETDAEDATQDTFIKIWQNIKKYKQQYKFSTWIYKITTHVCYDKLRSKQHIISEELTDFVSFSEENQEDLLHNKELKKLITKLSSGLSPKQKLLFILSDLEDLKSEEIVVITELSAAKIKSNLYLARKYIKSKIINL